MRAAAAAAVRAARSRELRPAPRGDPAAEVVGRLPFLGPPEYDSVLFYIFCSIIIVVFLC